MNIKTIKSTNTKAGAYYTTQKALSILKENGFGRPPAIRNFTTQHFQVLRDYYAENNVSERSQKTYFGHIRSEIIKKGGTKQIPTNSDLGLAFVGKREIVAKDMDIRDVREKLKHSERLTSIAELARYAGLRKAEIIKIDAKAIAEKGKNLQVSIRENQGKGGRVRTYLIKDQEGVSKIKEIFKKYPNGFKEKNVGLKEQLKKIGDAMCHRNVRLHGLRHAWAQREFEVLTGNKAPIKGGISEYTLAEKEKINEARMYLSQRLGHNRLDVTNDYLGRFTFK